MQAIAVLLVMTPLFLEMLVVVTAPHWLAPLARIPVPFTGVVAVPASLLGATVPRVPAMRQVLSGGVLTSTGDGSLVLRSALGRRRPYFLVRLWLERDGADVVVRAAQAPLPISIFLFYFIGVFLLDQRHGLSAESWLVYATASILFGAIVIAANYAWSRGARGEAIAEAVEHVERALRGAPRDA